MDKQKVIVEGFVFTDGEMMQMACQEAESVQYVRGHLDMNNPRMVLEMYRKLIAESVFETPVGYMYLKELQNYLLAQPELEGEELEPIQVNGTPAAAGNGAQVYAAESQESGAAPMQNQNEAALEAKQEMAEWYEEHFAKEKQKRREADSRRARVERKLGETKKYLYASVASILFFLIFSIGMIVITLTSDNPNIINYENKIVDKYEEWEHDLEEREQAVREQEKKLGISD